MDDVEESRMRRGDTACSADDDDDDDDDFDDDESDFTMEVWWCG